MSNEVRHEGSWDSFDDLDKILESWEQRITAQNLRIAERFLSGTLHITILCRKAIYSPKLWVLDFVLEDIRKTEFRQPIGLSIDSLSDTQQHTVLTDVINLVEQRERASAFVRLQPVDLFYGLRMNQIFYSLSQGFVSGFILANRKTSSLQQFVGAVGGMGIGKMESQVIEGPSEIIDYIPSGSQGIERYLELDLLASVRESGLDISLSSRHLAVKLMKPSFHLDEILFGPFNLCADESVP